MNFRVINAGNCMICGREIKIVTNKKYDKFPNVFFCPKCEKQRAKMEKSESKHYANLAKSFAKGLQMGLLTESEET